MKDFLGVVVITLFIVLFGLLMSIIDSCRGYEACLQAHSMKTCKEHWGREDEIRNDDY
jgi:hypothetical protein